MCGKNLKHGLKNFGFGSELRLAFVLLLLFVALPLSAADWAFLKDAQQVDSVSIQQEETKQELTPATMVQEVIQPQLQEHTKQPLTASTESSLNKLPELMSQLAGLENQSKKSILVTDSLRNELTDLKTKLEAFEELEKIEDEVHQETINALKIAEDTNTKQADEIVSLSEALKSEKKSKGYFKLNGLVGLTDEHIPEYGAGLSIGMRAGRHMLIEFGAQMMIGNIKQPLYEIDVKKAVGVVSIGWEF